MKGNCETCKHGKQDISLPPCSMCGNEAGEFTLWEPQEKNLFAEIFRAMNSRPANKEPIGPTGFVRDAHAGKVRMLGPDVGASGADHAHGTERHAMAVVREGGMKVDRLTREADFGLEDWEETLFFVPSDPNGAYNILDVAKYQGEPEFDEILKKVALRLSAIENILGDNYDMDRLKVVVNQRMTMQEDVAERIKLVGGIPLERLRELVEADRERRCVVLPVRGYTDKDGEQALNSAMNTCFYHNNPVTRYIADAVAEKLTREAAEAALKGELND